MSASSSRPPSEVLKNPVLYYNTGHYVISGAWFWRIFFVSLLEDLFTGVYILHGNPAKWFGVGGIQKYVGGEKMKKSQS